MKFVAKTKKLNPVKKDTRIVTVAHTYNLNTQEAGAKGLEIPCYTDLSPK